MKLSIKTFTILFAAATLGACNNDKSTKTETSSDSMSTAGNSTASDTASTGMNKNEDQDFINFIVPANMKELAWLKAGAAKGSSKEVKDHANMMMKDHMELGGDVKDYLSKHPELTMPAADSAGVVTINDKTGADFDKAFTDKMVDDHSALLDKLKKSQSDVKDSGLNKIIMKAIPVVESHLNMVKMMQDKMKK